MTIHPLVLLLSSFTASTTGHTLQQTSLQRHRILKETTAPPTVNDRLTSSAFNVNGDACSCSPTKFTFRINLSQSCNNDDISENAGIKATFCSVDDISGTNTSEDSNQEPLRQLKTSSLVEITSVQFLEFRPDSSLEVTYTDDTYLNATLTNGDTFTFYSSSSYLPSVSTEEQEEYVPGGVSLILHGRTEDGTVKRNRLYWLYDQAVTDCLENLIIPGIYVDDAIGWVVVDAVAGPWPQFCPAASPTSPTITPRTFDPTAAPTSYSVVIETSKSSKSSFVELGSKSDKDQVDSKAGKYGSKSSTNSVYVPQDNSSIEDKESVDLSSKSGKSSYSATSNPEPKSMSYSLSMGPSSDSSGSPNFNEHYYHDYNVSKAGKAEVDSKAVKNTSKASKNSGPAYVSKPDKGVTIDDLSKSGKAHDTSDNTMTSSTHWKPSADSPEAQIQDVSAKANGYPTKAYKILSPGAKTGKEAASKSNKSYVITDYDEIGSDKMSNSLSMHSNEHSFSTVHPQNDSQFVESKADKHSGKSSKVEHVVEGNVPQATLPMSSNAWSKSSKSYDVAHTAVEESSMSYSLSMHSRPPHQYHESTSSVETSQSHSVSNKSGKANTNAYSTRSTPRYLKSERAAIDNIDKSSNMDPENEHASAESSFLSLPTLGKAGKQDPGLTVGKAEVELPTTKAPLETAPSKSGKSMSLDGMKSSSGPAAFRPTVGVQSSLPHEFQSSKSSKAKETHAAATKSGKSEHDYAPVFALSKSGKTEHSHAIVSSMSYSLSMSSSYSMPEEEESNEPGLKQNSFETDQPTVGSKAPASSPSAGTDFGFTSDNTSTVSEIRSPSSGATSRSLATVLMLLLLQWTI